MKIIGIEARLAHPQASLIPDVLWCPLGFNEDITDEELSLMTIDLAAMDFIQIEGAAIDAAVKLRRWLCLLIGHKNALSSDLLDAAQKLALSPDLVFKGALLTNRLDILDTIDTSSTLIKRAIAEDFYWVFRIAAALGYVDVLVKIVQIMPDEKITMIMAKKFHAFVLAAQNGHTLVLQWLKVEAADKFQAMITADKYFNFCYAALRGQLDVMKWYKAEASDKFQDMVKAYDFEAFRSAVEYGHFEILYWLKAQALDALEEKIAKNNFDFFQYHAQCGSRDIMRYLLSFPTCLAYAELQEEEYGVRYTHPFISETISELYSQALQPALDQSEARMDTHDPVQTRLFFYIIRNLIRRNDPLLLNDIRFLLEQPSVKAIAHLAITPNAPNELYQLALLTENQGAINILLSIPAVRNALPNRRVSEAVIFECSGPKAELNELAMDFFGEQVAELGGKFGEYLKERNKTFWFRDYFSQIISCTLSLGGIATFLSFTPESVERAKYLTGLRSHFVKYQNDPEDFETCQLLCITIDRGLERFTPRVKQAKSLDNYMKSLNAKLMEFKERLTPLIEELGQSEPQLYESTLSLSV